MDWLDDQRNRREQEMQHGAIIDPAAIERAASRGRVALHGQIVELQKQRDQIHKSIIEHSKKIEEYTDQLRKTDELIADYRLAIEKLETK